MTMGTVSPQQMKITKARVRLLMERPFFGFLALGLDVVEKKDLEYKTMATDGRHLYFDPEFVDTLSSDQLDTAICHEVMHPALKHMWRRGNRGPKRWNKAADIAVNGILQQEGFADLDSWLVDRSQDGKAVEEIYHKLPDEDEGGGGGSGLPGGQGSHEFWGNGQGGSDAEAQEGEWQQKLAQAATQARMQGKLPGSMKSIIDEILEPKLPWKDLLRHFLQASHAAKTNYRRMPPNKKHLWRGMSLPSMYGEFIEVGFATDSSGSVSDAEIQAGASEIHAVCQQFEDFLIRWWVCDAQIVQRLNLRPFGGDEWPKEFLGRGGTDFRPVFQEIAEQHLDITCLIYITDLEGTFPDVPPSYPVLWLAVGDKTEAPFGQVIRLDVGER